MKKITMKNPIMSSWSKRSAAIGSMLALTFFAACGDDVTDNDPVTTQGYESEEAFPKCDADYEGYFATLLSSQDVYICTAKNWVNISKAGSNAGTSSKTSCTAEELSDGTGVEITCNGKKSVLQYGKQGAQGDPGKAGSNAENGKAGEPGGKGKDGDDAVPDADRCFVKYEAGDVVLFECGDSTYVRSMTSYASNTYSTFDVWKNFYQNENFGPYWRGSYPRTIYNDEFGTKATGKLVRWEGDEAWVPTGTALDSVAFFLTAAIAGTATVTVSEAIEASADKYRPFVGLKFDVSGKNIADIAQGGGFCLTYSSDSAMALLLKGDSGFVRAEIPATEEGEEAVVDISIDDFESVIDSVSAMAVMADIRAVYVEVVGGEAVGTYENKFAVYQFGSYGGCDGQTFSKSDWKKHLDAIRGEDGTFVDPRTPGFTYHTVTLGDQTWLAEDLQYRFRGSEAADTSICLNESADADTCETFGERYTWLQALNNASGCYSDAVCDVALPDTVQGICPDGWHLPNIKEWGKMIALVENGFNRTYIVNRRQMFIERAAFLSNKNTYSLGQNLSGLNLTKASTDVSWWSSTEGNDEGAKVFNHDKRIYNGGVSSTNYPITEENYGNYASDKTERYPVRCVKDAE